MTATSTEARGVSSVIGLVILVGFVATVVAVTVVIGSVAISDVEQNAEGSRAEIAMTEFDAMAARTALGSGSVKEVNLGSANGQVHVEDASGRIEITTVSDGGSTTIADTTLGAVVYETGDRTVAYQGGGVWVAADGASRMVSAPEYHYRGRTLTFPIIRVTEGSLGDSPGQGIVIRKAGFAQKFPTGSAHNPLEDGHVVVEVTSDYHAGWADYFETRTEGVVKHFPSNRTVSVNLTVPYEVDFGAAVATTADGPGAITTTGNAEFDEPTETGTNHPTADDRIESRIQACESGGCPDLTSELADGTVENGTYYEDGDVTLGPGVDTYDTTEGSIDVVVDGNLTFTGAGGPGTTDHRVTGGNRTTFYVNGSVTIGGNGAVNTGGDPNDVLVLVHSSAGEVVAAKGTPQFTGFIYAPETDFEIKGGGECGTSDDSGNPGNARLGPSKGGFRSLGLAGQGAVGTSSLARTTQPTCDGNVYGGVVARTAGARGKGKLTYPGSEIRFELAPEDPITYLHVTENRIEVTDA